MFILRSCRLSGTRTTPAVFAAWCAPRLWMGCLSPWTITATSTAWQTTTSETCCFVKSRTCPLLRPPVFYPVHQDLSGRVHFCMCNTWRMSLTHPTSFRHYSAASAAGSHSKYTFSCRPAGLSPQSAPPVYNPSYLLRWVRVSVPSAQAVRRRCVPAFTNGEMKAIASVHLAYVSGDSHLFL